MALGNNKPRNWGVDAQVAALRILLARRRATYKTVTHKCGNSDLMVAATDGKHTLPFETVANLEHVSRGCWAATDPITGAQIATGVSQRDVIRKAIEERWV